MIIELLGLPGCGKTSVYNYILTHLQSEAESVYSAQKLLKRSLPHNKLIKYCLISLKTIFAFAANFIFVISLPWSIFLRINKVERRVIFTSLILNILQRDYIEKFSKGAIILFDEGIIHRAYSIFIHRNLQIKNSFIRKYANTVKLPTLLFYLRGDYLECFRRLKNKEALPERLRGVPDDEIMRILAKAQEFLDVYVGCLKKRGLRVFVIQRSDISGMGNRIISFIKTNER